MLEGKTGEETAVREEREERRPFSLLVGRGGEVGGVGGGGEGGEREREPVYPLALNYLELMEGGAERGRERNHSAPKHLTLLKVLRRGLQFAFLAGRGLLL